jgi:hypothetical protein
MLDIVIRSYRPWSSRRSLYLRGVPAQVGSVSTDRAVVSVQTGGVSSGGWLWTTAMFARMMQLFV